MSKDSESVSNVQCDKSLKYGYKNKKSTKKPYKKHMAYEQMDLEESDLDIDHPVIDNRWKSKKEKKNDNKSHIKSNNSDIILSSLSTLTDQLKVINDRLMSLESFHKKISKKSQLQGLANRS
jgi:uncharacterized ubiquitin-like protein YukD